jgi:hypothetical protein
VVNQGVNQAVNGRRLISKAEWARERGVSKPYVSKLIKTGKIVLVDGKIDPQDAAHRLGATQDVVKAARSFKPVPSADYGLPGQLLRARIKREEEEMRRKEFERKRREGELVDASEVREVQLRRATEEREALLNWPSRIAPLMAADLEVNERKLLETLRKYIRQHLAERSSQPIERAS